MEPDEVRTLLRSYRENQTRAAYLETEAEEIRRGIAAENRPEMQAVHAQSYEISSRSGHAAPTEKLALWAMDGGQTASAKRWEAEAQRIEQELWNAKRDAARVDIWLLGLTVKERTVLTAHEIDGLSWPEVSFEAPKLMGYHMTPDGLRRIGKQAIEKVCSIAR